MKKYSDKPDESAEPSEHFKWYFESGKNAKADSQKAEDKPEEKEAAGST